MSKRPTRQHVIRHLIAMRKDIDRLINELTTDEDRRFVQSLQHDDTPSTRSPRYDGPEPAEVIAHRYGIVLDHDTDLSHAPHHIRTRISRILS